MTEGFIMLGGVLLFLLLLNIPKLLKENKRRWKVSKRDSETIDYFELGSDGVWRSIE